MTSEDPTPEGVQNTLRDYLRVATGTGELRGHQVEFSPDGGETWSEVLVRGHFLVARATVYREGWVIPTVLIAQWDEVLPLDADWRALWERKPQVMFGAFALRTALVRTFADVFGDRREGDDLPEGGTPPPPAAEPTAPAESVDWMAQLDTLTETMTEALARRDAVQALYEQAGKARVDPSIFLAIQRRLRELDGAALNEAASAGMVTAEEASAGAAAAVAASRGPAAPEEPSLDITEEEWLLRIDMASSDVEIDEIRRTLRSQPGGVTESEHKAMKRRARELVAEPETATAHAMRDALAKQTAKPTPLTAAAAARAAR